MLLNKSQYERINENDTFLYIKYPLICFLFVVIFYIVTAYFDTIAPDKFAIFFFLVYNRRSLGNRARNCITIAFSASIHNHVQNSDSFDSQVYSTSFSIQL